MGKIRNLLGRVRDKFFGSKATMPSQNSVSLQKYDRHMVENELSNNPELSSFVEQGETSMPGFKNLVEDVFGVLYKQNPILLSEGDIAEEYRANRQHVADLMESEQFQNLRPATTLNKAMSLVSAKEITQSILEAHPEETQERQQIQRRLKDLQSLLEDTEAGEASGYSEEDLSSLVSQIEQTESEIDNLRSDISTNPLSHYSQQQVRNDLQDTADKMIAVYQMLRDFGYSREEIERLSSDSVLEMLRINSMTLRNLAELIGRFRRIANRLLLKSRQRDRFSISGVTLGDDIADATESETVSFLHPLLRYDVLRRWPDEELEVNERDDDVPMGKGPIVCAIDVSGSMRGEKDAYTKALAMAYLEIARKERRDMLIIYFDHFVRKEYFIPKGKVSPQLLIEILQFFTGGRTDFELPLGKAVEHIQSSRLSKADILFVTDGIADVSDDFIRWFKDARKRLEFRTVSVLIPNQLDRESSEEAEELLNSLSDQLINLPDLTEESAENIIGTMFADQ